MDVTCERCGTEYEFDETLLSGRGTSVKCTNCGHVFKVYPRAQAESDRATSSWRLRLQDGTVDTIDSLRELQRRISSGELTPQNEIARGEEGWKTLGSIPELETFFEAAGVRMPPRDPSAPAPPSSAPAAADAPSSDAPSSDPPGSTSKESSLPPGRRPRQPTLLGVMPVDKALTEGVVETPAGPAPESATASADASATAAEPAPEEIAPSYESPYVSDPAVPATDAPSPRAAVAEDAEFREAPRPAPRGSSRTSTPPPAYYDDDEDIPELPGRGWSPLRWLLVVVAVGGLVLMGTQWGRVARLLGIGSDPALVAAGLTEGDAALREGHPAAYASAIEAYGRSIEAGGDGDSETLSRLSRAYGLAAQAQIDAGAPEESIESLSTAALTTAKSALELEPRDLDARLAVADALRLTGDHAAARAELEEARAMSFSRTAEFFRVDARLSAAEAEGSLEHGLRSAKQAAELAPDEVPYLLLLARAQHAADDDADARVALQSVLAIDPEHPVATRLLAELDAAEVVADAGAAADAGVAADAAVPAGAVVKEEAADAEAEGGTGAPTVAMPEKEAAAAPENGGSSAAKPVKRAPPKRPRNAPKRPAYDEYDQLAKAAGDDAFVDGRPPVRDYEWYMRQGRAELAGGNYSRARAFFDSALEARPGSADAMDGLGHVATRIEDFDSALRYFRVAAQRGHPDGYFNLGKTYQSLGQNEEAVSAYYTYVKRRPEGRHAAVAKAVIKTLEPRAKLPPEPEAEPETEPDPDPDPKPNTEPDSNPDPEPQPESGAEAPPPSAAEPAPESEPATP